MTTPTPLAALLAECRELDASRYWHNKLASCDVFQDCEDGGPYFVRLLPDDLRRLAHARELLPLLVERLGVMGEELDKVWNLLGAITESAYSADDSRFDRLISEAKDMIRALEGESDE